MRTSVDVQREEDLVEGDLAEQRAQAAAGQDALEDERPVVQLRAVRDGAGDGRAREAAAVEPPGREALRDGVAEKVGDAGGGGLGDERLRERRRLVRVPRGERAAPERGAEGQEQHSEYPAATRRSTERK